MAKTVTISQAEYEYMKTVIAHDGMTIARLEVELAQAKADIRDLLMICTASRACEYCSVTAGACEGCETCAEWRGYQKGD